MNISGQEHHYTYIAQKYRAFDLFIGHADKSLFVLF